MSLWSWLFGSGSVADSPPPRKAPVPPRHLEGNGEFGFDIVGESYYQEALKAIVGGKTDESVEFECLASLVCEDDNPHDSNAVAIYIQGKKVGHLARPVAAGFRDIQRRHGWTGQVVTADAMIVGGWDRGKRGTGNFGVKLDI